MALQGTLETFSVPEVLRLLASTSKTGLMALNGDRGRGKVWLTDGAIVAAESDEESGDVDAVLFDLLRFETGDFVFETDEAPDEPGDSVNVDKALGRAESMLEEWKDITSIVPSLHVGLRMVEKIEGESVTVSSSQWEALVAVGSGTTPSALRRRFELTEMDAYRRARDLVEAGLVEVGDEAPAEPVRPAPAAEQPPVPSTSVLSENEMAGLGTDLAGFVAQPVDDFTSDVSDPWEPAQFDDQVGSTDETPEVSEPVAAPEPAAELETDADEAEQAAEAAEADGVDFLSQLSSLSPKAAAAVEATAEEAGGLQGTGLPADADAGDEEINRNLLLKFLSSTKN